jgi:outer membrane murein-binding lipoprotein Lpp
MSEKEKPKEAASYCSDDTERVRTLKAKVQDLQQQNDTQRHRIETLLETQKANEESIKLLKADIRVGVGKVSSLSKTVEHLEARVARLKEENDRGFRSLDGEIEKRVMLERGVLKLISALGGKGEF